LLLRDKVVGVFVPFFVRLHGDICSWTKASPGTTDDASVS
jgi:hypothetical protein